MGMQNVGFRGTIKPPARVLYRPVSCTYINGFGRSFDRVVSASWHR